MAASKKTGKRNSTRGGAKKAPPRAAKSGVKAAAKGQGTVCAQQRIRQEIAAIVLFAVGAFLVFGLFAGAAGKLGEALTKGLSGLFGPMSYALPFFLIAYGIFILAGTAKALRLLPAILAAAVYILLSILFAVHFIESDGTVPGGAGLGKIFADSVDGKAGGALGMYIAMALVKAIGKAGVYILTVALTVISVILIINTPMSKYAGAARDRHLTKREERLRRREEKEAEWAEEEARLRDAAAVRGEDGLDDSGGAAEPEAPGGQGLFRWPSFLGGKPAAASDKKQHILDTVVNDENYGDVGKKREPEIEDTTIPFDPDRIEPQTLPDTNGTGFAEGGGAGGTAPVKKREKPAAGEMHYGESADDSHYQLPPVDLLSRGRNRGKTESPVELKNNAARLEQALRDFKVEARVAKVTVGPTVTRYEVAPDVGVKIQSIRSLEPDLALKLEVKSVRVVPMPGTSLIGIEAFNANTNIVPLREIIDSSEFRDDPSRIAFALGKNISGDRIVANLAEMPHLLIAGTTGSGKSVCINCILLSLLYRAKPSEVKLILIDPKVVELKSFTDIPHLLVPVVTDPEKASMALSYAVTIMNDRYKKFSEQSVRNLESYNTKMRKDGQPEEILPQIVIVIDELSDLMLVAAAKVQESISRLAAMARAAGMHLIVATQQPLASILTSVIKANIPSRIAFAVSSNSASRVILDNPGAERLHGKGDMLFSPVGTREPMRIQGAYVDESEVVKVVAFVKKQMDPDYSADIMQQVDAAAMGNLTDEDDELFMDAVEMVAQAKQASVSMIQRRFRVGYNRAARLVDMMEERGIVAPSDGTNKPRRVIMSEAQLMGFLRSAGRNIPLDSGEAEEDEFADDFEEMDE
ncbi:MAG: DNA translocase FtsK [Clostridiales Family XIII bacterium]|nr:DNA translocase FtsK [Clostridiales Family XIII bacterium]